MKALILVALTLCLSATAGCTAMMVGGGATYEPPADECGDREDDSQDCRS